MGVDVDEFRKIVQSVALPIIVAGGPKKEDGNGQVSDFVKDVVTAGAAGVAIGRRVWQADDPEDVTRQIHQALWAD